MRVSVYRRSVTKPVVFCDGCGATPVHEVALYLFALRMGAPAVQADFALDLGKVKRIVVPNQPNAVRPGVLSTEPAPVPTTRKNLTEVGSCAREAEC
jgi:hypothetical protein